MTDVNAKREQLPPSKRMLLALREAKTKLEAVEQAKHEPIAIIGMSCRFPGATSPEAFWQLMRDGVDAITEVPPDRWNIDAYYDPDVETPLKMSTRYGGFLQNVDQFDPQFFNISPREALSMDPQQRLLLEVSWEALERAAQVPEQWIGSATGVFVGVTINDYSLRLMRAGKLDAYFGSGNTLNAVAGRLAYTLGLQGPCMAVDTACSSSLVSVHLACQSLRNGECAQALAGGVNVILAPENTITLSKARMMAIDGRCKTFDANADGFVRGEGCGVLVLKRLSDAIAAGDPILALIKGSAVNQDGPSSGFTVPNKAAQQRLIEQALALAKVKPTEVNYVEAHGTGTALGDPIEVKALAAVLGEGRSPHQPLQIGSVKTNIGHLESAAGIAGLIKVVLSLQHQQIPPHLHLKQPNPYIPWDELPVAVTTEAIAWPIHKQRRIAGVSSFGASGTNAHVILEEAATQAVQLPEVERPLHLLTLSAKTPAALPAMAQSYQNYLETHPNLSLGDVCFTANTGRSQFPHRLSLISQTTAELSKQLAAFAAGEEVAGVLQTQVSTTVGSPPIAFLFTGQGSQYWGMARELYHSQPSFRESLEECDRLLSQELDVPLLEILYGSNPDLVHETAYTQPALFAVEYALARLWQSWGIQPSMVLGHSVGEYVAACIAGVFSLADGLKLIAQRGRLMGALPAGGQMVALRTSEAAVTLLLEPWHQKAAIAAVNGPESVVVSGATVAIEAICGELEQRGIPSKRLSVSHAFHSPLMEPMLAEFEQVARSVTYAVPQLKLISNLTGQWAGAEVTNPEYWCEHVRKPVLFAQGMATLQQQNPVMLEVGPQPVLLGMGRACVSADCVSADKGLWLPSLRSGQLDWQQMLTSLAQLYGYGVPVDWQGVDRDYARQRLVLPTYPFQRQRFWVDGGEFNPVNDQAVAINGSSSSSNQLLGKQLRSALKEIQFESTISQDSPKFLSDHAIYQHVVLPATAYVEMALAAGATVLKTKQLVLEDLVIQQALGLTQDNQFLQCILSPQANSSYSLQIFILSTDAAESSGVWTLHASGKIRLNQDSAPSTIHLADLQTQVTEEISAVTYYQKLRNQGLEYGPSFQGIKQLWRHSQMVLGQICLPQPLLDQNPHELHPALLDACFQTVGAALEDANQQVVYLPIALGSLCLYQTPGDRIWCQTQLLTPPGTQSILKADLNLFDETGALIAQIKGLSMQRASRQSLLRSLQKDLGDWLYQILWQPKPLEIEPNPTEPLSSWLILTDSETAGQPLAEQIRQAGDRCIVAVADTQYQYVTADVHYRFNPLCLKDIQQLLQDCFNTSHPPCRNVIQLWGTAPLSESSLSLTAIETAQANSCGSVLHLVQALAQTESQPPRLWIVTCNTQAVASHPTAMQPHYAALWGLGRVISLEHPELHCTRIDLDAAIEAEQASALIAEVRAADREDQVAYRQGDRYIARLVRHRASDSQSPAMPQDPFRLQISEYGVLENLSLVPHLPPPPAPHEVQIAVRAVGLNFRDVLNALGVLQEYLEQMGVTSSDQLPFGGECSGVVAAVGEQVQHLQVGDTVIAAQTIGSLSSYVNVPAEFVVRKPENLSFEAAATIPTAFLTAHYGLVQQAKLQAGERVLIHAAAGGVGQAAVQVAQNIGAIVWATASPPKWEHLQRMGVHQVMNSRTLEFAETVQTTSEGGGVEVVLNSLYGEFIPQSLACLVPQGRFVEIGKRGIWSPEQMQAARPDVGYFPFDLLELSLSEPQAIGTMLRRVLAQFEQGELQPIPYQVYGIEQVEAAFRDLAQAKPIGKVVITLPPVRSPQQQVSADATYLITGGLGALGLQVGQWLVAQGAKQLVLTSRRPPSPTAQEAIATLTATGATVTVENLDVSDPRAVEALWQRMTQNLPPLKGIVHAAGMLDDGLLVGQTWERFAAVLAAKVAGGWNLHHYSQNLALDFFVCFSSISSVLGSPGQGNYATANAFLDGLMQWRQGQGLVGQSVNWGPWSSGGMAAGVDRRNQAKWAAQGIKPIEPAQGLQVLGEILPRPVAQLAVLPVDWSKFLQQMPPGVQMPLLETFASSTEAGNSQRSQFLAQLESTPVEGRKQFLMTHIRSQIAKVLGLGSAEAIGLQQGFSDLGMDSLMAVELRNRLQTTLGCSISASLVFDYPTIESLVDYLSQQVLSLESTAESIPETEPQTDIPAVPSSPSDLEGLSDSEAESLLMSKLDSLRY
jgi:myxalamid-type polyketide synthase MxaB